MQSLKAGYQGSTHTTPDTSKLVMRVANRALALKLQTNILNREVQSKPVADLHKVGYRKFETASLAVFNKKISEYKLGRDFDGDELDELPEVDFSQPHVNEEDNGLDFDSED